MRESIGCVKEKTYFHVFILPNQSSCWCWIFWSKSFNPLLDRVEWWVARCWECNGRFLSLVILQRTSGRTVRGSWEVGINFYPSHHFYDYAIRQKMMARTIKMMTWTKQVRGRLQIFPFSIRNILLQHNMLYNEKQIFLSMENWLYILWHNFNSFCLL